MRVRRVLYIWKSNGIIDKDNFAFLTGLSTMQPLMIKKLILENAKYHDKDLTLLDIDFSKAYDSTEKFAKDMALRRLGFPQEGLDLWQLYDDTREMQVITAYGITDPITPECGAWGQGAVESPIGWLALMCWLSQYVEMNSIQPYTITVKGEETKFTKTIYADDGTYFQTHRKGIQKNYGSNRRIQCSSGNHSETNKELHILN
jgi:hypothetical protein